MVRFDFNKTKTYLNRFGISWEDYEINYGGLIGKFVPPQNLIILNPELKGQNDQIFYLMAISIFNSANNILNQKPAIINPNNVQTFQKIVGVRRANNFKLAIYEEIKYRCISNYLPELDNKQTFNPQNFQINENKRLISSSYDLFCNTALEYLEISDWADIDVSRFELTEAQTKNLMNNFLLKDFNNYEVNPHDWNKLLQVKKNDQDKYHLSWSENIKNANLDGCNEFNCLIHKSYLVDCNIVGDSVIAGYDDSKTVDAKIQQQIIHAGNFPWNSTTNYAKDQSCIFNTKFYVSLVDNNIGHSPDEPNSQFWFLKPDLLPELYWNKTESDARYVLKGEQIVIPAGQIFWYTKKLNPKPIYLEECNGQMFNKNQYPELFQHLGTDHLPDLRNRVLGHKNEDSVIGQIKGENETIIQKENISLFNVEFAPSIKIPVTGGYTYNTSNNDQLVAIAASDKTYSSFSEAKTIEINTWFTNEPPPRNIRGQLGIATIRTDFLNRWSIPIGSETPTPISNFQPTVFGVAYILMKPIKYGGGYDDSELRQKLNQIQQHSSSGGGYDDTDLRQKLEKIQQEIDELSDRWEHMND